MQFTNDGLPLKEQTLTSFTVPRPPKPWTRRRGCACAPVLARFTFSFTPPKNATRTLLRIVATDGRHLQNIVSAKTRRGSVPVIGYRDGVKITVIGLGADGRRGDPASAAKAKRKK